MKDLVLLGMVREVSTRCPNKMLRPFAGTTLFDVFMTKLEVINRTTNIFKEIGVAICPANKQLWNKSHSYDVKVYERDEQSILPGEKPIVETFSIFNDIDSSHIMWLNACFPLLKPDTIIDIGQHFIENDIDNLHCVKEKHTWYWDINTHKSINISGDLHTRTFTQNVTPLLESVNCCHIFNREFVMNHNALWKLSPYLYKLDDSIELIDINTEVEFRMAEEIYKEEML